jgi:hypothetical protein
MKRILLIFLLIVPFLGKASHIVGGEFELKHMVGNLYRLNLILYFDVANGAAGAKDLSVNARIYRSRDNVPMRDIFMPLISETTVEYTSIVCAIGQLRTNKLIYTTELILSDADFSDSMGYYVVWERCCRNYTITNILSNPPEVGQYAGQTFYLEIPPVTKNGEPFINSTPRLFPPLSDYGCVGKPYYVDFAGTDDDGDSLVYSLVTPLNTKTGDALPLPNPPGLPRPRPYPNVTWAPGYSLGNIMHGAPDLAISSDGVLTVTPTEAGLFVFAVKCIEYRDGVKIGETRRDFQMLTVSCPSATAPVVKGRKLGEPDFTYVNTMAVSFEADLSDDDRCIEIQITDPDVFADGSEFVRIKQVIGLDKKTSQNEVKLPGIVSATLTPGNSSRTFRICFDDCPLERGVPYQIGIIVRDDACALPLLDTLRVTVTIAPPDNTPAYFEAPNPDVTEALNEGTYREWPVKALDADGDPISVSMLTDGFNLSTVGMDFDFIQVAPSLVEDTLIWDAQCDKYDFSNKQNFHITLIVNDDDQCGYNPADTANFYLTLIPPPDESPEIDTDITVSTTERLVDGGQYRITETVNFQVVGRDADAYPISLEATGIGFDLPAFEADFPPATGVSNISSTFSWPLKCELFDLAERDSFAVRFIVIDKNNWCKIYQADTVDVGLKILPPINTPPEITAQNLFPQPGDLVNSTTRYLGNPVEFLLTGTDTDEVPLVDNISIELIGATGTVAPTGYTFTPVSGQRQIETKLIWTPDCSIFKNNIFENEYEFKFRVVDDHCASASADTVTLNINIKDYASTDENFNPVNTITPNGDDINDFFALDGYELRDNGTDPDEEIGLPLDNCLNQFEYISIYNRWGKLVFTSDNRFFRWYAPNMGAGVYYYLLKFTNKEYKSTVLVRY